MIYKIVYISIYNLSFNHHNPTTVCCICELFVEI